MSGRFRMFFSSLNKGAARVVKKPLVFPKGPSFFRRGQVSLGRARLNKEGSCQLSAVSHQPNRERNMRAAVALAHALPCGAHSLRSRRRAAKNEPLFRRLAFVGCAVRNRRRRRLRRNPGPRRPRSHQIAKQPFFPSVRDGGNASHAANRWVWSFV
jgi:hypothetical protein